jgi:hypothetical protein
MDNNICSFNKSLARALYKSESQVIEEEPILSEYNSLFSNYVTDVINSLETNIEEVNTPNEYLYTIKKVKNLTYETWQTFANGVRITKKGHDPQFNSDVSRWIPIFNNKTNYLSKTLQRLEKENYIIPKKYDYDNEDSKEIMTSLIKGYIL